MDGRADRWRLADKPKNQVDNEAGDACAQTNCLVNGGRRAEGEGRP